MSGNPRPDESLQDETTITEITIQPDGRIYVFGTSRQVLEVLEDLGPTDVRLSQLLRHVRAAENTAAAAAMVNSEGGGPGAT